MRIINQSKDTVIAENAIIADTLLTRMRGILGKKSFAPGSGLIITRCNSIHMFFMRFPIDVLFLDSSNKVVLALPQIKPWRISPICWKAKFVIELPAGTIPSSNTEISDQINILS